MMRTPKELYEDWLLDRAFLRVAKRTEVKEERSPNTPEAGYAKLMQYIEEADRLMETDPQYAKEQKRHMRGLSFYTFFHHWPTARHTIYAAVSHIRSLTRKDPKSD